MDFLGVVPYILIFCVIMFIITSRAKIKKNKSEKAIADARILEYAKIIECSMFSGLPVPKNTDNNIAFGTSAVIIKTNAQTFDIGYNKVIRIDVKTDEQIRTQYVANVGGAIAGAELFGPLGALIGGSPKEIKNKTVTTYLIITYYNGNTVNYASFVVKPHDVQKAPKLVAEIQHRFTAQVKHTSL